MTILYFFLTQAGSVMFHASVFRREFPEEEQQLGMSGNSRIDSSYFHMWLFVPLAENFNI